MTEQERLDKAINGLEQSIADFKPFCGNKADWQRVYDALDLLKAQEPRVLTLRELAFYDAGIFVETRNGCPEGLTDELWPALGHLYCVSQNGEDGYVSFVNWNADTYDFEAKDYNVEFRCWTSRPTDEQREAIPW